MNSVKSGPSLQRSPREAPSQGAQGQAPEDLFRPSHACGHCLGAPGLHPERWQMLLSREGWVSPPRQPGVFCETSPSPASEYAGCLELATRRERWRAQGLGEDLQPPEDRGARFVFLDNLASTPTCQEGGGMQESARPRSAVSREGPSIPVPAAMSPELKIVHETHKGSVTAALFAKFLWLFPILHRVCKEAPVVLVWTMLASARHRGRRE